MKDIIRTRAVVLIIGIMMSCIVSPVGAYAVPILDGSTLMGVNGLEVANDTWNVRFVEGSASNIWNGTADLDFQDQRDAYDASTKLMRFFNTYPNEIYGQDSWLTYGIDFDDSTLYPAYIMTPFEFHETGDSFIKTWEYRNTDIRDISTDAVIDGRHKVAIITGDVYGYVNAKLTRVSVVPLPAAAWLMGSGPAALLMGLSLYRKK